MRFVDCLLTLVSRQWRLNLDIGYVRVDNPVRPIFQRTSPISMIGKIRIMVAMHATMVIAVLNLVMPYSIHFIGIFAVSKSQFLIGESICLIFALMESVSLDKRSKELSRAVVLLPYILTLSVLSCSVS